MVLEHDGYGYGGKQVFDVGMDVGFDLPRVLKMASLVYEDILNMGEDGLMDFPCTPAGYCTTPNPPAPVHHNGAAATPSHHAARPQQQQQQYNGSSRAVRSGPSGGTQAVHYLGQAVQHVPATAARPGGMAGGWGEQRGEEGEEEEGEAEELQRAVMLHPLYPRLLEALCACRKVGKSGVEIGAIEAGCVAAKADAAARRAGAVRQHGGTGSTVASDPDLTEFLAQYIRACEGHEAELKALFVEVDGSGRELEGQVTHLLTNASAYSGKTATATGGTGGSSSAGTRAAVGGTGGTASPAHTRSGVTHVGAVGGGGGGSGTALSSGFGGGGACSGYGGGGSVSGLTGGSSAGAGGQMYTQGGSGGGAGSLGTHSGGSGGEGVGGGRGADSRAADMGRLLKRKFNDRIAQLTEGFARKRSKDSDKEKLAARTGLSTTQVNNWFINQRKRHWHKLFPPSEPHPETPEEAAHLFAITPGAAQAAAELMAC